MKIPNNSIKRKIIRKKHTFLKWIKIGGEETISCIVITMVSCLPIILCGIIIQIQGLEYISWYTSIFTSIVISTFFVLIVYASSNNWRFIIKNLLNPESSNFRRPIKVISIYILLSLIWISISHIINPILAYSTLFIIVLFYMLGESYNHYVNSKVGSIQKYEIREYKLRKIKNKIVKNKV